MNPRPIGLAQAPSGMSAAQTYAALTREQWANYLRDTVPFENRLISYSNDPRVVTDAMSEASADAQQAFRNRAAVQQRGLRSLGVTLDPDEQRAAARSTSLAGSLADVHAQNVARDATMARQRSVLGSPVPTLPRMEN